MSSNLRGSYSKADKPISKGTARIFLKGHPIIQQERTKRKFAPGLTIKRLKFIFLIALEYSK
jgi:hypothetical protein